MGETEPNLIISGFEILEEIGHGGFSRVHLAHHLETDTYCAVKIVNLMALRKEEFVGVMREISVFMQVDHPNICMLYNLTVYKEQLYFFMECAPNGTLLELVNSKKGLPEPEAHKLFIQLYSALRHLHSHHFLVHRDLKLENILMDSNWNVKLTDFGLASTSYCNVMRSFVGTPGYQPPEILAGGTYDEKCDVWSLGVCLYAMLTAYLPFTAQNSNYRQLVDEASRLQLPKTFSPALQDLLKKMLEVRANNRMTLMQLQNHPWLRGLMPEKSNFTPRPIVFYNVPHIEDIAKFKRRPRKPEQKVLDACTAKGIDPAVLTKDLEDGLVNERTTIYFCLLRPLTTKPVFEKPKATIVKNARKTGKDANHAKKSKSTEVLHKISSPQNQSGRTLRNVAKAVVVGPQKKCPRASLSSSGAKKLL